MEKIALLLLILSVNALSSMEPTEPKLNHYSDIEKLSPAIKEYINSAIKTYNNAVSVIDAVKADSDTIANFTEMISNQKGLTWLIHTLSNKFNISPYAIAYHFATPTAKKYIDLGNALIDAVKNNDIETVKQLIRLGADSNYYDSLSSFYNSKTARHQVHINNNKNTPLTYAVLYGQPAMVKVLLDAGAKPESNKYYESHGYYTPKRIDGSGITGTKDDREKIKQMIDASINK